VNVAYTFTSPQIVNIEIGSNTTVFLRADFANIAYPYS